MGRNRSFMQCGDCRMNKSLKRLRCGETQVTSSSLNLGSSSIETKQADHLSDLLRDLPGVDVGGTSSINNRISPFVDLKMKT